MDNEYIEITKKYYSVINAYCLYKLDGNRFAADDVTQEVFFTFYKKLGKLRMSDNIKLWLYRTADMKIKEYRRKIPDESSIEDFGDILTVEDSYPTISESDFDCLSADEKELLTEYYSGNSRKNLADSLKIPVSALHMKIYRIKKKLSNYICKNNKLNM